MLRALTLLIVFAACERGDGVHATRAQCEQLDAELRAWADRVNARHSNSPWYRARVFGADDPELCVQRYTYKQVDCMIAKVRADATDTAACKPR
jgi:hypothetical protein